MSECEPDQAALARLVGCWRGTVLHRAHRSETFEALPGTADNRWVFGGRFVEMTLRAEHAGDAWSAVFYIGNDRSERRHVLVSIEPGDRRLTTRLGDWRLEDGRFLLTSHQARAVCDMTVPGQLRLELVEEAVPGREFVRMRADYRAAVAPMGVRPPQPRNHRRFVIA